MSKRHRFGGRHELGQNYLRNRATIAHITDLVSETSGSILEIGAGDGAITRPLARLGRPMHAVELDPRRAARLRDRVPGIRVEHGDGLRVAIEADVVVSNVPFGITTPLIKRILAAPNWSEAILLTQWEVARKRSGVGGTSMLTAQWWPWFDFHLGLRIPSEHFEPRPSVDGGLLRITRVAEPLVTRADRRPYQAMVKSLFTGPGDSVSSSLVRQKICSRPEANRLIGEVGLDRIAKPRTLRRTDWTTLWSLIGSQYRHA